MMVILCCLVFAFIVAVVFLAWRRRCKSDGANGDAKEPASIKAGGVSTYSVRHAHHNGMRPRRTRLNADVVVDALGFCSPDAIDACCFSSRRLNSVVMSLKSSRPLRSVDFVRIGGHSTRSSELKVRCRTRADSRPAAMSFRDFALRQMQFALRNAHVRLLRIDEPQVEAIEKLADFTEADRCRVEELQINLMESVYYFTEAADYETVWRAVGALSPSRVHCAFHKNVRRYKCLSTPGFTNGRHVVVEGPMRAPERVLRYIATGRRGSLCWLSNDKNHADGCYFVEAIIEMFQAQEEIGSFAHPLFLQYPYRPSRECSEACYLEHHFGIEASEDHFDFRNIERFYPDSTTTFDKHKMRVSSAYKVFVFENASGQRIFVVASDDYASMRNGNYWLQRVVFAPDLSILGN